MSVTTLPEPVVLPAVRVRTLDEHVASGGLTGLEVARRLGPDGVVDVVTAAGVRGRRGAGFPAGMRWRSVRDRGGERCFVVVNGAEGEPATFKDRAIMRADPFQVIEGALIAALAVDAEAVVVASSRPA